MTLKTELLNLDQSIQTSNMDHLIERILDQIGSTDPELRDHLIYNTFGKLIKDLFEKLDGILIDLCTCH
ncbi:hypothetical protein [Ureibacillus manganicus]|uniref:Uncharacterized protein n=1 Tax=Ureibacillus manganicus DSM 26584 TaxID=1384049 RepID=A0A0A3HWD2_9BACL|nr:hypothetical protein [Ureibacillus manganicus]KGR76739.1 hypothetical protein CD29_16490 [Ureibacillus manganicus DSM 26584]